MDKSTLNNISEEEKGKLPPLLILCKNKYALFVSFIFISIICVGLGLRLQRVRQFFFLPTVFQLFLFKNLAEVFLLVPE